MFKITDDSWWVSIQCFPNAKVQFLERLKKPLVSTSANLTGAPTAKSFKDISPEIINGVDYVVNWRREETNPQPSTIIKLSLDNQVKIIRP
jgi:L-threonylcarbamoyladenylate synthase